MTDQNVATIERPPPRAKPKPKPKAKAPPPPNAEPSSYEIDSVISRLHADLKAQVLTVSPQEGRFLVDLYYQWQSFRTQSANQERACGDEPHALIAYVKTQNRALEDRLKGILAAYSQSQPIGRWAESIYGIGPVISAGLLAHIDIHKAPTVGHIWSFAGLLDPRTQKWESSQKVEKWLKEQDVTDFGKLVPLACNHYRRSTDTIYRYLTEGSGKADSLKSLAAAIAKRPYNLQLRTLLYHAGESFVKLSGRVADPRAYYPRLWVQRKQYEVDRNDAGGNAEYAKWKLENFTFDKGKSAYKAYIEGKLPDGQLQARSRRWISKLFIAHWHAEQFRLTFGKEPPNPYPIEFLGHTHAIAPPPTAAS